MATVLIVEDNVEIAQLYERIFEKHQTCVFYDLPETMHYLETNRPDLVITDFHLPSGSGVEILQYIRSEPGLRDVPVLGISVDDTLKTEARERGIDVFLTKPIDLSDLINAAQRLLSSTRKVPSHEMQAALRAYAAAYQKAYNRLPHGQWTGTQVLIDGQPCDEAWLQSETHRLQSLTTGGVQRNYLHRLIDKLRRL
jgi:CheY-like chemotaxis protein